MGRNNSTGRVSRQMIERIFRPISGCDVAIRRVRDQLLRYPINFLSGIFLAAVLSLSANADPRPAAAARSSTPQEATRTAQVVRVDHQAEAVRVDHSPSLNGTLDDPLWQSATPITDFRQREPYEGEAATEKTEVRILYTRTAVYFGIHCYDSEPSRIAATELRRDANQDLDDHFEILIDQAHDRRDAYVFEMNPLGTQYDGLIVEEQGARANGRDLDFDPGWDGVWTSEARVTSDGWTATVEVPFSTLNFTQSKDIVWGLNFKRFIRRKNEEDLWSAYRRTFGITKVSEGGELRGITDIQSGRLFIVKPYGLATYDKLTGGKTKFPLTGGLDIKYGLRSDLILNVTGNTDFADADVDLQQFNLTPFKIFIPEKRQFFLENAGIFSFDIGDRDQLFSHARLGLTLLRASRCPSTAERNSPVLSVAFNWVSWRWKLGRAGPIHTATMPSRA